jgi:hypothetical protein
VGKKRLLASLRNSLPGGDLQLRRAIAIFPTRLDGEKLLAYVGLSSSRIRCGELTGLSPSRLPSSIHGVIVFRTT